MGIKKDYEYFLDDDNKPLHIGAGDVLAIHDEIGCVSNVYEAYALGWNECRKALRRDDDV